MHWDLIQLCKYHVQVLLYITRVKNVSQSARLFTFCVLDQSECLKFEIYKQKEGENNTLFYALRAIRYETFYYKTDKF